MSKQYRLKRPMCNVPVFVYALKDPRTNEFRYVGQSANLDARLIAHIGNLVFQTEAKEKWIDELRSLGLKPDLEILEEIPKKRRFLAEIIEIDWIDKLLVAGHELFNYIPFSILTYHKLRIALVFKKHTPSAP
jgi:hypothetical protein